MWSRGDDGVATQVFWRGWEGFEPEAGTLFYNLARRASVVFDVGAHVGFYSLVAAGANPHAQIFSFEPMAPVFQRLRNNIALNRFRNVQCFHTAVGEETGNADFYHVATGIPSSSSLSHEFMQDYGALEVSTVPVIRLDDFVQENGIEKVDLMKLDTETTEPQVLRGMIRTLRRDHPGILCEVLPGYGCEQALQEILSPLDYNFYLLTQDGPQQCATIEAHPQWRNYLFTTLDESALASL